MILVDQLTDGLGTAMSIGSIWTILTYITSLIFVNERSKRDLLISELWKLLQQLLYNYFNVWLYTILNYFKWLIFDFKIIVLITYIRKIILHRVLSNYNEKKQGVKKKIYTYIHNEKTMKVVILNVLKCSEQKRLTYSNASSQTTHPPF